MREQRLCREYSETAYRAGREQRRARRRRARRLQCRLQITAITAVFVIILALSLNGLNAQATTAELAQEHTYKYYTSVQIAVGDSLWSIAADYTDGSTAAIMSCIDEMRSINHLGAFETIKAGDSIVVPYVSSAFVQRTDEESASR